MSVTNLEEQQLMSLIVSMFDAIPGKDNYDNIMSFYVQNHNLDYLANALVESDIFKNSISSTQTNSDLATFLTNNFGLDKSSTVGESIYNYFLSRLDNEDKIGTIFSDAVKYLTENDVSKDLLETKKLLENKVEIGKHYSLIQERNSSDIEKLKSYIEGVTSSIESRDDKIEFLNTSESAKIEKIIIPDGFYTYGAEVNIEMIFNEKFYLSGDLNCKLIVTLGESKIEANLASFTDNSIFFKFIIEDGYYSKDTVITISKNALVLNDTIIKDSNNLNVIKENSLITNELAVITDIKPPEYTLFNSHYSSTTNTLSIYGKGFNSLLESTNTNNDDISSLIDFTKLIWDFNGDDFLTSNTTLSLLSQNVISSKVKNDNELNIVYNKDLPLENDPNFNSNDTLDVYTGFLSDKAGNISTSNTVDNTLLSIDNIFIGNLNDNIIYGTINSDEINSFDGDDIIKSQDGNDIINAGNGKDIIEGGLGADIITGGSGNDIFIFNHLDSVPYFTMNVGIDTINDLFINGKNGDLIDLDVDIERINVEVTGSANKNTFVSDLNLLLSVENKGFNKTIENDISASIVNIEGGDLDSNTYLAIDYNENDIFDLNDIIINITNAINTNFNTDFFI